LIPDIGVPWRWVRRYGEDAMLEASERADQLLEDGDPVAAAT
jgi:hypothetical protein